MEDSQSNRAGLEQAILSASKLIREDKTTHCLDAHSVEAFLEAWRHLVTYYEENDDRTIGVEIVREYLDWLTRFSTIWHSERRLLDCREMASEACEELEVYMDGIIKAVDPRIYPTGR